MLSSSWKICWTDKNISYKKIILKVVGNELRVDSKGNLVIPVDKGVAGRKIVGNHLGVDSKDILVNPGDEGVDDVYLC